MEAGVTTGGPMFSLGSELAGEGGDPLQLAPDRAPPDGPSESRIALLDSALCRGSPSFREGSSPRWFGSDDILVIRADLVTCAARRERDGAPTTLLQLCDV